VKVSTISKILLSLNLLLSSATVSVIKFMVPVASLIIISIASLIVVSVCHLVISVTCLIDAITSVHICSILNSLSRILLIPASILTTRICILPSASISSHTTFLLLLRSRSIVSLFGSFLLELELLC